MAFNSVTVMFSKNGDTPQSRWRQDLATSNAITCSLSSTVGVSTYRWRLIGRPEGSGAGGGGPEPLDLGTSSSASFTSDIAGTYTVECLVNGGAPDATILRGGCAILESITAPGGALLRLLGPGETDEDISDSTVAQQTTKILNRWLRLLAAGGVGGGAPLAADYSLGTSSADQTLSLTDLNGGELVIDATSSSFSGSYALRTIAPIGVSFSQLGAGLTWSGGLELGPDNILIGGPYSLPTVTAGVYGAIGIGWSVGLGAIGAIGIGNTAVAAGISSLAAGSDCTVNTDYSVGIGPYVTINGITSIGIGPGANVSGIASIAIGSNASCPQTWGICISGQGNGTSGIGYNNTAIGNPAVISGIGDWNVLLGGALIGDGTSGETRYFGGNVRVGNGGNLFANHAVSLGFNTVVGDTSDLYVLEAGIGIGYAATVTGSYGIAVGYEATAGANEMVVGSSSGGPIHTFTICGNNGGTLNTLKVTDAPANDFQTGLSIPYRFSGGTVAAEDVYAKDVPPLGALHLYIPGPPS